LSRHTAQLARRTESDVDADWVIRSTEGKVVLLPASGSYMSGAAEAARPADEVFAVGSETDPALADAVRAAARRIARARNLLKLAEAAKSPGSDVQFDVELVRYQGETPVPVPLEPNGRTLRDGDVVAFRITNTGRATIDVSLLLVGSGYGIDALFPSSYSAAAGRLTPGQTTMTGQFNVIATRVEQEEAVAIAVAASNPPVDFTGLAQEALPRVRATRSHGPGTGLENLLTAAMFGDGRSHVRALSRSEIREHAMAVLAWRTEPRRPHEGL
jgi:hypothetical protein